MYERDGENEQRSAEYAAWLAVVAEWCEAVGDMNEPRFNPVIKAINEWGEALARLRATSAAE